MAVKAIRHIATRCRAPDAMSFSVCCGWQRWWPDSRRRCIGIEMAGDLALCSHGGKRGSECTAGGVHIWTAWVEGTTAGDVQPVRDLADNGESPGWRATRGGGRGHQGSGVGVPWLTADAFSTANLNEFAQIHDPKPITHVL